jgi:hypothetical protein
LKVAAVILVRKPRLVAPSSLLYNMMSYALKVQSSSVAPPTEAEGAS